MTESFDVIVIGAGPGGYVAAIRCAQLGLKTVCVDKQTNQQGNATLGGTCLNVGCIPSKALLDSSEQYHRLSHQFPEHGISAENVRINIGTMHSRKNKIVKTLTNGIQQLFKANKITFIHGFGKLVSANTVAVLDTKGKLIQQLTAHDIILAPGSLPVELSVIPYDGENIVDSTGALSFAEVPKRLGVIGAGVIGLELGSVWNRLGAEVTLLEASNEFLSTADRDIAREAKKQIIKQQLDLNLGVTVSKIEKKKGGVHIFYEQKQQQKQLTVDKVIVAAGRRPSTNGLIAHACDINIDAKGFIEVDEICRTQLFNVWAIGDAVRGPMLAHKSSEEGIAVSERIAGKYGHIDFNTIPWVIYTAPEIAWVGKTERQIKQSNIEYKIGLFPFAATGRAWTMEEPNGFVKIIADKSSDRILGVHMIGAHVSELIAECVLAMEYHGSSEDLARTIHAHPSLSEAVHEAALAADKRAIHKFG